MNAPFSHDKLRTLEARLSANAGRLLIDGEWHDPRSGVMFDVLNPATGEAFASAAAGDAADVDLAVSAARKAFDKGPWPAMPPAQKARLLIRLADLIEANAEELALIESLDNGMPFMVAKFGGAMASAEQLRYFAGWATKISGETITPSWPGEWHAYTRREAVGVVGSIVPWNFPLVMSVAKLAPALSAGCTVVLKPAEQTPLSALRLGELVLEAGFPNGVVNIVTGFGEAAGAALVAHPCVDKIAFTGSTSVGSEIVRNCAGTLKRVTLELGGKSPTFIFPDAKLEKAIPAAAMGIFGNTGQVCAAGSRLFVHEDVFDRVIEGICERARNIRVGAGLAPGTEIGPLVSEEQRERVLSYVASGHSEGASIVAGGDAIAGEGYFVQPTVLVETTPRMRVAREEIFGPVLCAMRFGDDDLDTLAAMGNDTEFGLASSIWTSNISTAHRLANRLKAGTVRINGGGPPDPALPLGGFKTSGWGRENGRAGFEIYTELKTVSVALG